MVSRAAYAIGVFTYSEPSSRGRTAVSNNFSGEKRKHASTNPYMFIETGENTRGTTQITLYSATHGLFPSPVPITQYLRAALNTISNDRLGSHRSIHRHLPPHTSRGSL